MGNSKIRSGKRDRSFYPIDQGSERWREWASDHNRSDEYDTNSTLVKRSWIGRLLGAKLKSKS